MQQGLNVQFTLARAAATIIVAMFLALLVLIGLWLQTSHREALRRTEERAVAASKIVATNVSWYDSLANQALQRIDELLGDDVLAAQPNQVRNLNEAVADLPGQVKAYVTNADGLTLYSNEAMMRPINISDRQYFTALAGGADRAVSELLISRLSGRQVFAFSKRLERAGRFVGAAVVTFEVEVLAGVWEAADLGPGSTVSFARTDGQLVARYPLADGPLDMSKYVLFTDYLPRASAGTYDAVSPVDSVHRIVAYRTVGDTGLIALASANYTEGMLPFWRDVVVSVSVLTLASICLLAAAGWIRHLRQRDAAQSQLLRNALADNQLLLREIHHRVKNNLQSVLGIIQLQRLPAEVQISLADRIAAMIAVHEQIYRRDEFAHLGARELLTSVIDKVVNAYGATVTVTYDIQDVTVSTDVATPLALLANEVLTNALKYAFPDGRPNDRPNDRPGTLTVTLVRIAKRRARLTITDDGQGFDPAAAGQGMGTRLIKGVVSQLNGRFTYGGTTGTTFMAELDILMPEGGDAVG